MIKTFPYLEVSGTHADVGEAIGEMFRGKIRETMEDRKRTIAPYEKLLAASKPYFEATNKVFPDIMEELAGMARSAEVSLPDLFFHNNPEVYDQTLEWDRESAQTEDDHCTIVVSKNEKGPIIGHNEDWAISSLDELYVLKTTIGDTTTLSLNYATFLPGSSASITNWGMVQCINELHQVEQVGVAKYFTARAILSCKTLADVEQLLGGYTRAAGYNHVLVQGDDLWDIEIAAHDIDFEKRAVGPYVHTNHCISQHMLKHHMIPTPSSRARLARASELVTDQMSKEDMQKLLSDTKNQTFPICREDQTIGSVIIEPKEFLMHICYGHPCAGEYVTYEL